MTCAEEAKSLLPVFEVRPRTKTQSRFVRHSSAKILAEGGFSEEMLFEMVYKSKAGGIRRRVANQSRKDNSFNVYSDTGPFFFFFFFTVA